MVFDPSQISPVIVLPFTRMPYPSYQQGVDIDSDPQSEDNNVRMTIKRTLEYIDAWTMAELDDYDITITEGAEQSMVYIFAGKALEIARTTCNRDIYVLMEVPSYGYSTGTAADVVNGFSRSFYNGEECLCFNSTTCNDPTVTISVVGWFTTTDFPVRMGGDGNMYAADSPSDASPWFESMVFPENPSGVFKIPRHPNVNRRVCDGVYRKYCCFTSTSYVTGIYSTLCLFLFDPQQSGPCTWEAKTGRFLRLNYPNVLLGVSPSPRFTLLPPALVG